MRYYPMNDKHQQEHHLGSGYATLACSCGKVARASWISEKPKGIRNKLQTLMDREHKRLPIL
jgi:hypothetical protein